MKFCTGCGGQNSDDAKFCEYCGKQFVSVEPNQNTNNTNTSNVNYNGTNLNEGPRYQTQESAALGICALIFSLLGGWLGLLLAIICLATKRDSTNRTYGMIALGISIFWIVLEIIFYSTGIWTFGF